ncbi:hypothetical protein KUTeg_004317 [Tegillarca granosa]|uniref:Phospholipase B-like n=1 Tax=Tegillarca granosa TaxID=220873 RepID=A0ABQ9FSS9_TEGGR|nr:hypothetical protein KUTeg_004317 [Tegillarca granosa]
MILLEHKVMMGARKLCFLFLFAIFVASEGTYNYGSLYCENDQKLTCHYKPNVLDVKGAVAVASYNDTLMETGWGILDIASGYGKSITVQDRDIMYAAGFLEGTLTAKHIYQHYQNMKDYFFKSATTDLMQDVKNFFAKQDSWLRKNVEDNANDPFWRHAGMIISQFDGLVDGYKSAAGQNQNLDVFAFQALNGVGDLIDLMKALQPSSIPDWTKMTKVEATEYVQRHGMCSALVKVLGAYENLFMSHSSWFEYQATLRIYKHYNFNVLDSATAAKRISFSSYPGFLESLDDFYLMSSQMVMLQTTNNVFNTSLYKFVQPQSLLAWQRIRMANMMAHSGKEWAGVVSKYNSGTYNNQYMIIDLKKIQLGKSIGDDALWVIEQIPTLVKSGDQSEILRADYENDKYSEGDSCNAICCRGDLKHAKPGPFGCYDTKVADYEMALNFEANIISGPTTSHGLPAFEWTESYTQSHIGLPKTYNFPFITTKPRWDNKKVRKFGKM